MLLGRLRNKHIFELGTASSLAFVIHFNHVLSTNQDVSDKRVFHRDPLLEVREASRARDFFGNSSFR